MAAQIGAHDARGSASTRASRRCWTSCATCAGAASRRPSARTRTSSAPSAPPTCAASSRRASSPPSSTSPATPPPAPAATSRRCRSGPRELADVILPPFEMALRDGGARSVMNSYTDIDGVPAAADPTLLTDAAARRAGASTARSSPTTSRSPSCRRCTASPAVRGDAARARAARGHRRRAARRSTATATPLLDAVAAARSTRRSSTGRSRGCCAQKAELGLLDAGLAPRAAGAADERATWTTSRSPRPRAARSPERSVVLLRNDGDAAAAPAAHASRSSGPRADDPCAMLGCYSFPAHVGVHHPDVPIGRRRADAARGAARRAASRRHLRPGCAVLGGDDDGHRRGRGRRARRRRVRGGARRPGRACSAAAPPARAATPPTCACPAAGGAARGAAGHRHARSSWCCSPAARTSCRRQVDRLAGRGRAAFFPGEEGGPALAGVLSGRVEPGGPAAGELPG